MRGTDEDLEDLLGNCVNRRWRFYFSYLVLE